jgi:hypothetical protein
MRAKTTSTNNNGRNSFNGLLHLLFSEKLVFRWFRLWTVLSLVIGWGIVGALIFETDQNRFTYLNIIRYSLPPLAAIISVLLLGAHYLQDIYELPSFSSSLRYLIASMFDGPPYSLIALSGRLLPSLNISNGKVEDQDGDINLLQRIGGPGWLSVERGNVVLLEYLHSPAKVLGPGFHFIPRLMHVEEIFNLEDQYWEASPIVATTKDGIEVAVHNFQFGYRLASHHHNHVAKKRTTADPYPFSAKSVWKLAYNPSVPADGKRSAWGKWVQGKLDGVITEFINKESIDEIIAPTSGRLREVVLNMLSCPDVRKTIIGTMGTEVTWLNIGRFDIKDEKIGKDIKDYRLKAWFAEWAGKASLIRAEGKAEQISQTEGGRIEKTTSMLRGILQALGDVNLEGDVDEHLWNIVLARTAQIIEAMTSQYEVELSSFSNLGSKEGTQ